MNNNSFEENLSKITSFNKYNNSTMRNNINNNSIIYNKSSPISIGDGSNNNNNNNNDSDSDIDFEDSLSQMMTAETPPDPFITIQNRTRLKWIDDNNALKCNKCEEEFRLFLRRHHCILKGTPVTLANGMARKIEDILHGSIIASWDLTKKNVVQNGIVHNNFDQGLQPCMKITLEDDRQLITTSDHKILSITNEDKEPKYRLMKNLNTNHRVVCSVLEGVLDDPIKDGKDTMDYVIPGPNLSIKTDRDKCLAFARLCGYSLTDGSIDGKSSRVVFIMGDSDDVEAICLDLEMLLDMILPIKRPTLQYTGKATIYRIEMRNKTLKLWLESAGVTVGNKVNKGVNLPHFMWDDNCPKSIKREFIAGWFGGDGSRFDITTNKTLKMNDHMVSVSLQESNSIDLLKNSKIAVDKMNEIIRSFGVDSFVVLKNAKSTIPKLYTTDITSRIGFRFNVKNAIIFNKNIGFRYCIQKQTKMTIGSAFENYKKRFDKIISGSRRTYESKVGKILASSPIMSFDEFLNVIEFDWNKPSREGKRYFTLQIVKPPSIYKNGKKFQVYDLSIPSYVSFVANGMIVHNCRNCGAVFCGACSDNWSTIPDCITQIPTSTGIKTEINRNATVRLCDICHDKISLVKQLEILLKSVQLVNMDIIAFKKIGEKNINGNDLTDRQVNEIPDMKDMNETDIINYSKNSVNGKLWKQLANFYLSKIREIQYKLPYQEYSEWDKNATWINYKHFKNHDIWMVHTIRSHIDDPDKISHILHYYFDSEKDSDLKCKNKDECWDRMCTRQCQTKISWESSLILLDTIDKDKKTNDITRKIITENIIKSFNKCDDKLFECILPYIIDKIINAYNNEDLIDFVINRCIKSKRISNHVYWSLIIESENKQHKKICEHLISRLLRETPKDIFLTIMGVQNFVRSIEDNFVGGDVVPIKGLDIIGECISPTNPENGLQNVDSKALPREKSANCPVPISLFKDSDKITKNIILYKREDLRTDLIIMSIIRIMKKILEDKMKKNLYIITYNIQPTSSNSGFIKVVNKSNTLYDIEENFKVTLSNHIKKHNPNVTSNELTLRFIRSCAFYSVITFLLGIGDRHLDNIMLTENGEMFHIDYGFVLGKDPKPMNTPSMRITDGMLDAIGGYNSESYQEFKDLSYNMYDILRRHVNTFVCLLSLLPKQNTGKSRTNPKITNRRLLREIVKRFAPGETSKEAKTNLHTRIDKSINATSISKYHIVDFFHRHNKEQTITNVLSYTFNTTLSGTKSIINGVWNYLANTIR